MARLEPGRRRGLPELDCLVVEKRRNFLAVPVVLPTVLQAVSCWAAGDRAWSFSNLDLARALLVRADPHDRCLLPLVRDSLADIRAVRADQAMVVPAPLVGAVRQRVLESTAQDRYVVRLVVGQPVVVGVVVDPEVRLKRIRVLAQCPVACRRQSFEPVPMHRNLEVVPVPQVVERVDPAPAVVPEVELVVPQLVEPVRELLLQGARASLLFFSRPIAVNEER